MSILTSSWCVDLSVLALSLLTATYLYFQYVFTYWTRRGVQVIPPSIPFGNFRDVYLVRKQIGQVYEEFYNLLAGAKFGGVYQILKPTLLIRDLDLIKQVFVKEASSFQDRGVFHDEENDPLSATLFNVGGQKWKFLRAKLTPTFTSGKMKMMFHTLLDIGDSLKACIERNIASGGTVEVNDILARYSTDVIASVAFGIECNCLSCPDAEFRVRGRQFFQRGFLGNLGFLMNFVAPRLASVLKWGNTPRAVAEFFTRVVDETVEYRETNQVARNDFMQMMIQLKNDGYVEGDKNWEKEASAKIDMKVIAAQAFVFYLGGFETSSSTMTFALYELALNPEMQTRLRTEIDETLAQLTEETLTYEALESMEYLNMVVSESLRKYPILTFLNRECSVACAPEGSGGLRIEEGTQVVVSVSALHNDPELYPDPQRFDPERFTKEARTARNPYSYLPFGVGPRNCIGNRFGLMQVKVGLTTLLRNFVFSVAETTPIPLVLDPASLLMVSQGGMPLSVSARS